MTSFPPTTQRVTMRYVAAALAVAALYPRPAGACPDLTGSYMCDYDGDGKTAHPLRVTQEIQSGNTVFSFDGKGKWQVSFTADGEIHEAEDIESVRSMTLRGWCEGDNVKVDRQGVLVDPDDGKEIGKLALTYTMHLEGNILVYVTTGFAKAEGREIPTDETVRCERKRD